MNKPMKKEIFVVQFMLGISLIVAVFAPLIMFLITREGNRFYRETSRKALNFHLTILPFFVVMNLFPILPTWYFYVLFAVLIIEYIFIIRAMILIALRKPHSYLIAIPFLKKERNKWEVST